MAGQCSPDQKGSDPNESRYRLLDQWADAIASGCAQSLTSRYEPATSKASGESPGFNGTQTELAAAHTKVQEAISEWSKGRLPHAKLVLIQLLKFIYPRRGDHKLEDFQTPESVAYLRAIGIDGKGDGWQTLKAMHRTLVSRL